MYEDIIDMPHHVSSKRVQMSMHDRAAQFSPFAALTGYDAIINETARLTDRKIELDEEELYILDIKFHMLIEKLEETPEVTFTHFVDDARKYGGKYLTDTFCVKQVDTHDRMIEMCDGTKIHMDDILSMESEIFRSLML